MNHFAKKKKFFIIKIRKGLEVKIEITLFPRSFPFCKERPFFFIFYSFGNNMFFLGKPKTKGSLFFFFGPYTLLLLFLIIHVCVIQILRDTHFIAWRYILITCIIVTCMLPRSKCERKKKKGEYVYD